MKTDREGTGHFSYYKLALMIGLDCKDLEMCIDYCLSVLRFLKLSELFSLSSRFFEWSLPTPTINHQLIAIIFSTVCSFFHVFKCYSQENAP